MQDHHGSFINLTLSAIWMSSLGWVQWFGDTSHILTVLGIISALLQVAYLIRKHLRLGNDKS